MQAHRQGRGGRGDAGERDQESLELLEEVLGLVAALLLDGLVPLLAVCGAGEGDGYGMSGKRGGNG